MTECYDMIGNRQVLETDKWIEVPCDVAVCPYCPGVLSVISEAWEEHDGLMLASEVTTQCSNEPNIDDPRWKEWFTSHSYMPYVHELPVHAAVLEWFNANYTVRIEE